MWKLHLNLPSSCKSHEKLCFNKFSSFKECVVSSFSPSLHCKIDACKITSKCRQLYLGSAKRRRMQFTYVTCSLSVKTVKFTRVQAAYTSCRIHANCLQPHVNLLEYRRYFTGNLICGTHAILPTISMQNCLSRRQQQMQPAIKNTRIAGKNTLAKRQK